MYVVVIGIAVVRPFYILHWHPLGSLHGWEYNIIRLSFPEASMSSECDTQCINVGHSPNARVSYCRLQHQVSQKHFYTQKQHHNCPLAAMKLADHEDVCTTNGLS